VHTYELYEGIDDESFRSVSLIHEKYLTEIEFDALYTAAKFHADVNKGTKYLGCELIAESMCKLYGFIRLVPIYSKHVHQN